MARLTADPAKARGCRAVRSGRMAKTARGSEMSDYEELVERITPLVWDYDRGCAERVLAEVLRTLETVAIETTNGRQFEIGCTALLEWLRASPLTPAS
jgi:hypothetical protein